MLPIVGYLSKKKMLNWTLTSPPNLQLICKITFWVTEASFLSFEIVLELITWLATGISTQQSFLMAEYLTKN